MKPKVSIFIPTFNRGMFVGEAIKSLLDQDFEESFEIIIIDDGSTDQTPKIANEILRSYNGDLAIKFIESKNNIGFEQLKRQNLGGMAPV